MGTCEVWRLIVKSSAGGPWIHFDLTPFSLHGNIWSKFDHDHVAAQSLDQRRQLQASAACRETAVNVERNLHLHQLVSYTKYGSFAVYQADNFYHPNLLFSRSLVVVSLHGAWWMPPHAPPHLLGDLLLGTLAGTTALMMPLRISAMGQRCPLWISRSIPQFQV